MTVKGDFARLNRLSASLRKASLVARKDVLKLFAADVGNEVYACFASSRSPYGEVWPPLKHPGPRRRGGQPLLDTARLRNSIRAAATATGVQVTSNVVYAGLHNYGGEVRQAERSELRRYRITGKDRRTRVGLNSRAARSVRKGVSIGAKEFTVPKRQYLPDETRGLPFRWRELLRLAADEVQGQLRLGGL